MIKAIQFKEDILLIGINSKYIHPSMGIFQIKANLQSDANIIEFTIKDDTNKIISYINSNNAKVIGLSVYIWNINIIKIILPKINNKIIILGGPEASFDTSIMNLTDNLCFIIKGEGEDSFNELISYLNNDIPIDKVSNLLYKDKNEIKYTYFALPDLSKIKHDLSLIKDYKNRICYLESSRGCYYNCTYCLASTEKPVRLFPINEIKDNILFLLKKNCNIIKFLDRSFNVNPTYALDILKFIKEHDNNITTFQFEINGDTLTSEVINLINSMRKNMIRLEIGIQSTNVLTNKAINRHQNFARLVENINKLKDNTIIHTDLIAGLPLEGFESFKKSFNDTFLLFTEELQLGLLKELKGTVISSTKDLYGYVFQEHSPFEVIKNNYITSDELDKIRLVEMATDRFYNYGYFNNTINHLFKRLSLNPFETFLIVMTDITKNKALRNYQFDELTYQFFLSLSKLVVNQNELLFIIKKDYLLKNRIKPKIWWESTITREERNTIYNLFKNKYNLNIDELYKYAHLEKYLNNYLLINYKDFKVYELELSNK